MTTKLIYLTFCFFILTSIFTLEEIIAETYYIATNGSDSNNGSTSSPWSTFAHAMTKLQPGDTLIIKDGTYYQSLIITVLGKQGNPITFKAENDGQAIIDGQSSRWTCAILEKHDIVVVGVKFQNSSEDIVKITNSDRITLKRVSAYNAGVGNYHVFSLWSATNTLLEDCAASGSGRQMYNVLTSRYVTLRRCWGRWQSHSGGGGDNGFLDIYGTDDSIVENCVGTKDPATDSGVQGMGVWANYYNDSADRNKFLGNVVYNMSYWAYFNTSAQHRTEGNQFENNVSINTTYGYLQRGDANSIVRNNTIVGASEISFCLDPNTYMTLDDDYLVKCDVRNTILLSGGIGFSASSNLPSTTILNNSYNDLHKLSTAYSGLANMGTAEINVDPGFNIDKYGLGAYLFVPEGSPVKSAGEDDQQMGAEVLKRHEDGMITGVPLWPWPMEERIFNETGVSATWATNGGLWKTLDGVYSASSFDFSMFNEGPKTVVPGSSVTNQITVTLVSGSLQPVTNSISGLPAGVSGSITPEVAPPSYVCTLIIQTLESTPEGAYTLTVTGTGGGITHSTAFNLTVTSNVTRPSPPTGLRIRESYP